MDESVSLRTGVSRGMVAAVGWVRLGLEGQCRKWGERGAAAWSSQVEGKGACVVFSVRDLWKVFEEKGSALVSVLGVRDK